MIRLIGGKRFPDFEIRQTQQQSSIHENRGRTHPRKHCRARLVLRVDRIAGRRADQLFLAEYFEKFNEDNQDNFCEETIGL